MLLRWISKWWDDHRPATSLPFLHQNKKKSFKKSPKVAPQTMSLHAQHQDGTQERMFGLDNFGNTCYANAILQCLFHCEPFRLHLMQQHALTLSGNTFENSGTASPTREALRTQSPELLVHTDEPASLMRSLRHLFELVYQTTGASLAPAEFMRQLRMDNVLFSAVGEQQDAQEFLNFMLNNIAETLAKRTPTGVPIKTTTDTSKTKTWIHSLFEGELWNETRCLKCDSITKRVEPFLDLQLHLPSDHCSLVTCLSYFSTAEKLCGKNQFHCDKCRGLQDAEKRFVHTHS
jgi:ubiquitin carboxyl-terminal hydrolase 12/46